MKYLKKDGKYVIIPALFYYGGMEYGYAYQIDLNTGKLLDNPEFFGVPQGEIHKKYEVIGFGKIDRLDSWNTSIK